MGYNIISYIAGITSLVALFVSIYNSIMAKRRLVTETITKNRIEWIIRVRDLLSQFIEHYHYLRRDEMRVLCDKLALYMNDQNTQYIKLIDTLRVCSEDNAFSQENIAAVILTSQHVLAGVWTRMKREAGVKGKTEIALSERVTKELIEANLY